MNKKFIMLIIITSLSVASFAQTVQQNIDKAAKNPATKQNAAKADLYIHKKAISNSTTKAKTGNQAVSNKKKKKKCKKQ